MTYTCNARRPHQEGDIDLRIGGGFNIDGIIRLQPLPHHRRPRNQRDASRRNPLHEVETPAGSKREEHSTENETAPPAVQQPTFARKFLLRLARARCHTSADHRAPLSGCALQRAERRYPVPPPRPRWTVTGIGAPMLRQGREHVMCQRSTRAMAGGGGMG